MQPKIGDKFKLGAWICEVDNKDYCGGFHAKRVTAEGEPTASLYIPHSDADSLEWIKEPATISQEAMDEIMEWATGRYYTIGDLGEKLDSMVKKEV